MISQAAVLALVLLQGERADRLASYELDVTGPAAGLTVEVPSAGRGHFEGSYPAGARARTEVVLPAPARGLASAALESFEGSGRVEVRPRPDRDAARRARFDGLPHMLRARAPVTPPEAAAPAPRAAALLLAAGLFAVGWQLRRRGIATLALGAAGAAAVFWLAQGPAPASSFTVAEGQGPDPRFVLVDAARGRLAVGGLEDLLRLESRPGGARLTLRGTPGRADLVVESPGATLFAFRDGGALTLGTRHNGVFDLEQVWIRAAGESTWVPRGAWPRGAELPELPEEPPQAATEVAGPPGWLIGALPQGPGILVGGGGERWLRWIDFPGE